MRNLTSYRKEFHDHHNLQFLSEGIKSPVNNMEIIGQGMKRLMEGGWQSDHGPGDESETYADERIAGSREFVERIITEAGEKERWRSKMAGKGWTVEMVIDRAAKEAGITPSEVKGNGKRRVQCLARHLACKWLVADLGKTEIEVAGLLGLTQASVSICVRSGRILEKNRGIRFEG